MPPASSAVPMLGRTTWRKVWKPSAPRSIDASISEPRGAAEAGDGVVVDDNDAEGGVAKHDRPDREGMSNRLKAERSAMPVMMPGSAIGRMTSSEIASRPKNFAPADRGGAKRAEHQREQRWRRRRPAREAERVPDIRAVPGNGEPLQREARRRPLIALLLGGEGVDEDQEERQVQEQQAAAAAIFSTAAVSACWRSERIEGPLLLGQPEIDAP